MNSQSNHYSCAVLGDWHLAFVSATCLAELGHHVVLVNPMLPATASHGKAWEHFPLPPVFEPGLAEWIEKNQKAGRLHFANGVTSNWTADRIWLAVDTPVNDRDEVDLQPLETLAEQVAVTKKATGPFIVNSQVPVGFCTLLEKKYGFRAAYIPENLRLGKAIDVFMKADRTVIGATAPQTREEVKSFLKGVQGEFLLCDLPTAEMVKHATNAFLATSISFANELAQIGESLGADCTTVAKALKLDLRIGKQAYVMPGLGFAGGTLPRDLRILQGIGTRSGIQTPLVDAVLQVNESTASALVETISQRLGAVEGKKILIMGYTYKADTDTLRRSFSVDIARELTQKQAQVWGYDPVMNARELSSLSTILKHCNDWSDIQGPVDAVLMMTPRKEFLELSYDQLRGAGQSTPPFFLDAHRFIPADKVLAAGLSYKALWHPVAHP